MLNSKSLKTIISISVVLLTLSILGCASARDGKRADMEKLLTAAGFRKAFADTPEQLAELKKLPQGEIVPQEDGTKVVYIYVDAGNCRCAYIGDEKAYQKYQKLTHAKQMTDQERREAVRNKQRQMDSDDASFGRSW